MEPEGSLPHSQVPANCPYPEPARSAPYPHIPLTEDPSLPICFAAVFRTQSWTKLYKMVQDWFSDQLAIVKSKYHMWDKIIAYLLTYLMMMIADGFGTSNGSVPLPVRYLYRFGTCTGLDAPRP